ncbi:MAG: HAMP domain-containing protein [Candidatus Marinimicrobia bacterium]|nr:HAMP domain-containing protein [Candidatus Neomarinimicrobiota bacterium]MCF7827591.1 HAMP domain-containing protein [Candidatus Neomarinimicrobiota bacterium]MCF7881548.1 HAMP domain-containing protein [Candidatus Neomarinimicrobiota bacterium]
MAGLSKFSTLFSSLSFKLFIILLVTVITGFTVHGYFTTKSQTRILEQQVKMSATRTSDIVKKSLYTNMLLNERERTHENIQMIGTEPGVEVVRIYNKSGEISFSSREQEIGKIVDMQAEACYACHAKDQPLQKLPIQEKARIYSKEEDYRVLGLINPIENDPECSNAACHAHSPDKTILGVLDVQMSLKELDAGVQTARNRTVTLAAGIGILAIFIIAIIIYFSIYVPTKKLRIGTEELAEGNLDHKIALDRTDELGKLAHSFNRMSTNLKQADQELREWSQTLEERVQEKTEELEEMHRGMVQVEKMASLGKMAATVAHELNNPLSGIGTYAKVLMKKVNRLMDDTKEREDVLEELDLIRSESMRCGNIVKDLLIFARESSANFQEVRLHQVIERALKLVRHHLELGKIQLERQFRLEDDSVVCDQEQMVQALVALMVNAVEAMSEGGKLTVGTQQLERDEQQYVKITVADTGVGMTEEVRDNVFDPFFSTKNETKGVGLGLAVVYGIIQRHDGHIDVESEPGKGTTFFIELPRDRDKKKTDSKNNPTVAEGYENGR